MKILAIADTEERCLWERFRKERFEGVDLILSAGDLDPDYLEFLVTVINKPLIYVRGNHDDRYARHAPGGCICVEDSVYVYRGVRIAGLGGSMRYRDGANMYTEREMAKRVRKALGSDIGIGITGWAGPDGDDVGLVFVALASRGGCFVRRLQCGHAPRPRIRLIAASNALDMIRRYLTGLDV